MVRDFIKDKTPFILLFLFTIKGFTCTTILCGKNTTIDKSVIMGHNEDLGMMDIGKLWYVPKNSTSRQIDIQHISYNLKSSFAYWATGNANNKNYRNILVGVNENGVSMSCNWMNSKEQVLKKVGINRFALRQLILEEAKTAKEAVLLIGKMIETHGQADWSGLTYCLSDSNESWVVETTTSQWVAKRVADDEIYVVANRYTIGEVFDLHSKKLYDFAIKKGWYNKKEPFNFSKVYGDAKIQNQHYDSDREERVRELLNSKKGFVEITDIFGVLRDRYFGTDKHQLPLKEECKRKCRIAKGIARPISTNFTQSSFVAHLREGSEVSRENMFWYAFASPSYSGYFPVFIKAKAYTKQRKLVLNYQKKIWMLFKELQLNGDKNYTENHVFSLLFWKNFEQGIINKLKVFENRKTSLTDYKNLTKFTQACYEELMLQRAILAQKIIKEPLLKQ